MSIKIVRDLWENIGVSKERTHLIGTTDFMKRFNALLFETNNRTQKKPQGMSDGGKEEAQPNIKKHFP